ncbi:MAG: acyl-ACP thioesterase domain-containing protein [Eggerthellaceae bacterium]
MRLSRLIETFQEAAIANTELLGRGRERTLDRGILWAVVGRSLRVNRWPRYGERIVVESWPRAPLAASERFAWS